ncbi:hypothetical protein SAMD00020551_1137 [Mesobacillus selenatarsenatis SF-1]|uniref:Uncharacterized protein n=1 Tax=Mesobacillus selenatarsenatis (strain DSM 18680 / JCM 14380 / FERM P-15431 / SF-1) TaxID=1321606 RepID=A0A0A8X1V0_MESS1|nr:hypothetical protein SAMD00020551_1137 [Mesobacillus selenatarsenatis SF-1]
MGGTQAEDQRKKGISHDIRQRRYREKNSQSKHQAELITKKEPVKTPERADNDKKEPGKCQALC